MSKLKNTCLMAGTFLCITPLTAMAEDVHANHHDHGISVGTASSNHDHHAGHDHSALAPLSVMGDHTHDKGDWMVSYKFQRMVMDGNRQGTSSISPEEIVSTLSNPNAPPANVRVVPTEMDMDMHMFGAMYGVTDRFTVMAMAMYMKNEMDHITFQGMAGTTRLGEFTTRSSGWGDTSLTGIYKAYEDDSHTINVSLGLSAPTGSIKEEDDVLTPMNTNATLRLPYAMQLGSGTWDAMPGVTYSGHKDKWSWGAQYEATIRLEDDNSQGYRLGNKHSMVAWGGYQISQDLGVTTHLRGEKLGKIKGRDANITAPVQTANPDNYGGERLELGLGFQYAPSYGALNGMEYSAEISVPVHQDLNGVQMERDLTMVAGISYRF